MGYYSITLDTEAIMNYKYKVLKSTLNSLYQYYDKESTGNEVAVLVDAIALILDEKAIAELIPGNALFVLHDLKKVKRDFIRYDYDENYQQIETKETKDEIQPNFSLLINTKNESFANRLLQLPLNKSKFTNADYQLTNGYYTLHLEKDDLYDNLYIGLKNGVLMLTSSKPNIESLIQQTPMPLRSDFKKSISKNNSAAWFDIQKIVADSKTDMDKETKNYYNVLFNDSKEIVMESKFKNGAIVSDLKFTINEKYKNSLQYFFELMDNLSLESQKKVTFEEPQYGPPLENATDEEAPVGTAPVHD